MQETRRKNRDSAFLTANDSRTIKMRTEPSVVSLVSLYNDQGQLPEEIFSNDVDNGATPKRRYHKVKMVEEQEEEHRVAPEGRAQCKRSGSTLRQLLGASDVPGDASEGDISWAERFLAYVLFQVRPECATHGLYRGVDTSSNSSHSSLCLPTPVSGHEPEVSVAAGDTTIDDPAISSMDVEVSISTDCSRIFEEEEDSLSHDIKKARSYESTLYDVGRTPTNKTRTLPSKSSIGFNGATPQRRASQVFEFIKKRASKFTEKDERDLSDPPSTTNSPSSAKFPRRSSEDRAQLETDSIDEREVSSQLTSQLSEESGEVPVAKENVGTIKVHLDNQATPSSIRRRPISATPPSSHRSRGSVRGLIKRLSFNVGAKDAGERAEDQRKRQNDDLLGVVTHAAQLDPVTPVRHSTTESNSGDGERDVRILMTGPTKVIVTAPTPGTGRDAETGYSLSKIPRGPRSVNTRRRRTSGSSEARRREERRRARVERERDSAKKEKVELEKHRPNVTTSMISQPRRKVSSKSIAGSNNALNENENARPGYGVMYAEAKRFVEAGDRHRRSMSKGSGDTLGLGVQVEAPMTPLRVSRRMSVNQAAFFQPPGAVARSGMVPMASTPEEGREERRRPRGERALYALPGSRSGNARQSRAPV